MDSTSTKHARFVLSRYKREVSAAAAYAALLLVVGVIAPAFFSAANWRDLAMNNAPVLIVAAGMTMVILTGHIDISAGSQFAVCSVAAGWLCRSARPIRKWRWSRRCSSVGRLGRRTDSSVAAAGLHGGPA